METEGALCLCLHPLGSPHGPHSCPWCEGQVMSGPLGWEVTPCLPWSILRVGGVHSSSGVPVGEAGAPSAGSQACPAGGRAWFRLPRAGVGRVSSAAGGLATQLRLRIRYPAPFSPTPLPGEGPSAPSRPPIRRSARRSGARTRVHGRRWRSVGTGGPLWRAARPMPGQGHPCSIWG